MNHLTWETPTHYGPGPESHYGMWEGTKVFNIHWGTDSKSYTGPKWVLKCNLPGFRPDLPRQATLEAAQAFCEKMLTRWVAKRGLLFKKHISVTDAMKDAAKAVAGGMVGETISDAAIVEIINAALAARG